MYTPTLDIYQPIGKMVDCSPILGRPVSDLDVLNVLVLEPVYRGSVPVPAEFNVSCFGFEKLISSVKIIVFGPPCGKAAAAAASAEATTGTRPTARQTPVSGPF